MSEIKSHDIVWEKETQIEWEVQSRASARDEEPPVLWKCGRWDADGKFEEMIFEEVSLTKKKPPSGKFA